MANSPKLFWLLGTCTTHGLWMVDSEVLPGGLDTAAWFLGCSVCQILPLNIHQAVKGGSMGKGHQGGTGWGCYKVVPLSC